MLTVIVSVSTDSQTVARSRVVDPAQFKELRDAYFELQELAYDAFKEVATLHAEYVGIQLRGPTLAELDALINGAPATEERPPDTLRE